MENNIFTPASQKVATAFLRFLACNPHAAGDNAEQVKEVFKSISEGSTSLPDKSSVTGCLFAAETLEQIATLIDSGNPTLESSDNIIGNIKPQNLSHEDNVLFMALSRCIYEEH